MFSEFQMVFGQLLHLMLQDILKMSMKLYNCRLMKTHFLGSGQGLLQKGNQADEFVWF